MVPALRAAAGTARNAVAALHRRAPDPGALQDRRPRPNGYALLCSLVVAVWVARWQWVATFYGAGSHSPAKVERVLFPPARGYGGHLTTLDHPIATLPSGFPGLTLDLLATTAVVYVGIHLLAALAGRLTADEHVLPQSPATVTPTWPRLTVTAAVTLQALVVEPSGHYQRFSTLYQYTPQYVFTHVWVGARYVVRATLVALDRVVYLGRPTPDPGLPSTYLPPGVLLAYLLALPATYLGVALATAGARRAVAAGLGDRWPPASTDGRPDGQPSWEGE